MAPVRGAASKFRAHFELPNQVRLREHQWPQSSRRSVPPCRVRRDAFHLADGPRISIRPKSRTSQRHRGRTRCRRRSGRRRDRTNRREFSPRRKSSSQACRKARRAPRFADCLRKPEDAAPKSSMNKSINAAVYERHGNPADVLRVESRPRPTAAAHEVVVQMRAAPINPADLNQIEGKYPVRFPLPATPGFECAGVVVNLGKSVRGLTVGALVILPHNLGTWRDAVAVKASELVTVPPGIDPVHAAMLKINPMTAWRLLHDYVDLKTGDWLIQNAANSAAGRAVIQIAHDLGYRTVNVVRREELIDELRAEGGDVVLVDGENLRDEVKNATNSAPIALGLNAVGGDSALRLANCLAPGSTVVTFGAMSLRPLKIPNGLLIFKDLRFRGIWINKWYNNATIQERMDAFHPLFEMAKRGLLKTKVEKAYPLMEAKAAVTHAAQGKRSGKIIFEFA